MASQVQRVFLVAAVGSACLAASAPAQLADLQAGRNYRVAAPEFGTGRSTNVDVGDCDNDGDLDVIIANGDTAPQANVIYINDGGIQGGATGSFTDGTATRFSGAPMDNSQDIEFVDADGDCDLDIHVSNSGNAVNGGEVSRFYRNQGGAQFGPVGFYAEDTDAFWGTLVSIPAGDQVTGGNVGPWRDYSCNCDFGDLDLDGDVDLFHNSYGPGVLGNRDSRVFLNDGTARFDELWPWVDPAADIQLHTFDADLVDLDADFDLDIFASSRDSQARVYRNNLQANGTFPADPFTDITQTALIDTAAEVAGLANYETEYADLDGDGDFDQWAVNYNTVVGLFQERILLNNGDLTFTEVDWIQADPDFPECEADFLDFDGDGDLDVFLANCGAFRVNTLFASGLAHGLAGVDTYHATGVLNGAYPAPEVPAVLNGGFSLDGECADMDGDGDDDILLVNDGNTVNRYWQNSLGIPDTHAPTVHLMTVQGNKADGTDTTIRAQLRDNASYYIVAYYGVDLLYRVDGGIENRIKMRSQGSQQFQGTIPGGINGTISYRVAGSDLAGNAFSTNPVVYTQTSSGVVLLQSVDDGTPGIYGRPYLEMSGSFVGGSVVTSSLCDAAPNALAALFVSSASIPTPFKGGLLHTVPVDFQFPLPTDSGGVIFFQTLWPFGLPSGADLWYQYGIVDASNPKGATLSNAVKNTLP